MARAPLPKAETDLRVDLRIARRLMEDGPQSLAVVRERGRTEEARLIEGRMAWARGFLASRGQAVGPTPLADPAPTTTISALPKGSAPVTVTNRTGVDASWDAVVSKLNRHHGLTSEPDPVDASAASPDRHHTPLARRTGTGAAPSRAATDASWAAAVAAVNAEEGLTPRPL